jgi:hypothetical protein
MRPPSSRPSSQHLSSQHPSSEHPSTASPSTASPAGAHPAGSAGPGAAAIAAGLLLAGLLALPGASSSSPATGSAPAAATPSPAAERWWQVLLAGQPAGWVHETVAARAGGGSLTTDEMRLVINRLGNAVEIHSRLATAEDPAGAVVSVHAESSSSQQTTVVDGSRTAAGLELHSRAGDRTYTRTLPLAGPLLGPQAIAALSRSGLAPGGAAVSYLTVAPDGGSVTRFTRRLLAAATLDGQPALQVEESNDSIPGRVTLWLDAGGQLLRRTDPLPFGEMETHRAGRAAALRAAAGGELPAEAYDRTMARSNVRLPDPRAIDAMKIELTQRRPDLGWPAFDGPAERVAASSPAQLTLEVWRPSAPTPGSVPVPAADSYLRPNALLQSDDPEVMRLARSIAGGESDPYAVVRRLQDWTAANLRLDLGVAVAPASEVVRNRRGTCLAYAVLLASLERAAGIPSRVAMGLVYYEGIWGGHAWTEALIGGRWLPFDAAVYRPGVADAARIQFSSYTAEDNLAAFSAAGLQIFGNVEVRVVEYSRAGRTVQVPAGAPGFAIDGDLYRNPWLGVTVRKPAGARFTRLDAVYPDPTVAVIDSGATRLTVAVESLNLPGSEDASDPDAALVRRLTDLDAQAAGGAPATAPAAPPAPVQRSAAATAAGGSPPAVPAAAATPAGALPAPGHLLLGGRPALVLSSPRRALLAARDGGTLWVLTAEGADAPALLQAVAATWLWAPSTI